MEPTVRWQYAIASIGVIGAADRLQTVLGALGADGWELVSVFDKSSNFLNGMEKGFVLFKRPVPDGHEPEGGWAVQVSKSGRIVRSDSVGDVASANPQFGSQVPW